ncbi:putative monooxygenase [Planoprotostelium fungivorum]|uniref:Putative monooxygenase n=1 Tax=Planoprotostelium fungivorum TaxID=1890364 RepID=A0A2P6NEW2_9EUKA|nr:putative monooxygenase [Planoprotostelium fungivorum]
MNIDEMRISAGPTGVTAALLAERLGLSVCIVDKASGPLELGRADALNSRTQELFEVVGALQEMTTLGLKCNTSSTFEAGQFTSRQSQWWTALTTSSHPHFLMLGQSDVTRVLQGKLKASVIYDANVDSFEENSEGVSVVYNTSNVIKAKYLFAADGARSFIRTSLMIPFEGTKPEMTWAVLDAFLDTDFPLCSEIITFQLNGQSRVSWIPRERGMARFYVLLDGKQEITLESTQEEIKKFLNPHRIDFTKVEWFSAYEEKKIILGGDAAHVHAVNGGQGLNTGVSDAFAFVWRINLHLKGLHKVLRTYEEERHASAQNVINIAAQLVRSTVKTAKEYVNLVEQNSKYITGAGIEYGTDSDVVGNGSVGPFHAGMRSPELHLIDKHNAALRLYSSFPYGSFVILLLGTPSDSHHQIHQLSLPPQLHHLIQTWRLSGEGQADREYQLDSNKHTEHLPEDTYIIIRPDTIVAYVGQWTGIDSMICVHLSESSNARLNNIVVMARDIRTLPRWKVWMGIFLVILLGHPLYELIENGKHQAEERRSHGEKSKKLSYARAEYIKRYGFQPPKGFDEWHEFQQRSIENLPNEAVHMIQYDRLMEDILPYRAMHPKQIRKRMWHILKNSKHLSLFKFKGNHLEVHSEDGSDESLKKMKEFINAVGKVMGGTTRNAEILFNLLDEPRVMIPHQLLEKYKSAARRGEYVVGGEEEVVKAEWYRGEEKKDENYSGDPLDAPRPVDGITAWTHLRDTCPKDSPSSRGAIDPMAGHSFPWEKGDWMREQFNFTTREGGFIQDVMRSMDPCLQNDLQGYHGIAIRPTTIDAITNDLYPIMSQASVLGYNDIIVPSGRFHYTQRQQSKKRVNWEDKSGAGRSTGGWAKTRDWKGMQRQRMVCRLNRPTKQLEPVLVDTPLGVHWVNLSAKMLDETYSDVAITHFQHCDKISCNDQKNTDCLRTTWSKSFDTLPEYRYLIDVDGNSFSSRFQELLRFGSVVLKSALVYEWFTESLIPWYHYVPMNLRYSDTYNIITWFEGFDAALENDYSRELSLEEAIRLKDRKGEEASRVIAHSARTHRTQAKSIATQGVHFTTANLRREDTMIYMYRVIIEWAALLDIDGKGGDLCDFGC